MLSMFAGFQPLFNGCLLNSLCRCQRVVLSRPLQTLPRFQPVPDKMNAWQLNSYGNITDLTLSDGATVPVIRRPDHVLVQVHAASVNPIDIVMLGGYGSKTFNFWRGVNDTLNNGSEFPLVPGRDFSGYIVKTGCGVGSRKFKVGDEVFGAGDVAFPGTHAQYVSVSSNAIAHKPKTVSHIQAASLPYVAATVWSAICTISCYSQKTIANKRVLVFGGSGGIGTFVIQLLKAWGAEVYTTCSTDAIDKVLELGADVALDYTQHDAKQELQKLPRFDLIFDAVGGETTDYASSLLLPFSGATYVRLTVPFMVNNNEQGMAFGLAKSACQYSTEVLQGLRSGVNVRWGLFMPNGVAMETVANLVDDGKIKPQVQQVFPFSELPAAYEKVQAGRLRGKIVIDVIGSAESASSR